MSSMVDRSVRPLFIPDDRGNPFLTGSGILLSVGTRSFLLTAAHVFHGARDRGLYVGGLQDLVLVNGPRQFTQAADGQPEDRADVGFAEMTPAEVRQLGDVVFLGPTALDPDDRLRPPPAGQGHPFYFILGYPASRMKRNPKTQKIKTGALRFLSLGAEPTVYKTLGLPEHSHLVVEFDRRNSLGPKGPAMAADPHGTSGGGAWRCDDLLRGHPSKGTLIAVMIEWHHHPANVLVGTRIGVVLEGIRAQYPELNSLIPRPSSLNITIALPQGTGPRPHEPPASDDVAV